MGVKKRGQLSAGPYAVFLFELLVVAEDGAAHDGILAAGLGLMLVPQIGGQQIEVSWVAELAFVVDDENQLRAEAYHVDGLAIEQLVQLGQLKIIAVGGADRLRRGAVRVEQVGLVSSSGVRHGSGIFEG